LLAKATTPFATIGLDFADDPAILRRCGGEFV
jgi:hypothetical protein